MLFDHLSLAFLVLLFILVQVSKLFIVSLSKLLVGVVTSHLHDESRWPSSTFFFMHCCFQSVVWFLTTFLQHLYSQEPNIPLTTFLIFFVIDVAPIFVNIVDALVQICDKSSTFMAFFSWFPIFFFHLYCCLCLSKNHVFSCSIFASWSCYCICISNLLLQCVRACNKPLEKWQVTSTTSITFKYYIFSHPFHFFVVVVFLLQLK